jgi:hypothetical protein
MASTTREDPSLPAEDSAPQIQFNIQIYLLGGKWGTWSHGRWGQPAGRMGKSGGKDGAEAPGKMGREWREERGRVARYILAKGAGIREWPANIMRGKKGGEKHVNEMAKN